LLSRRACHVGYVVVARPTSRESPVSAFTRSSASTRNGYSTAGADGARSPATTATRPTTVRREAQVSTSLRGASDAVWQLFSWQGKIVRTRSAVAIDDERE
jgi:hypothetical protein